MASAAEAIFSRLSCADPKELLVSSSGIESSPGPVSTGDAGLRFTTRRGSSQALAGSVARGRAAPSLARSQRRSRARRPTEHPDHRLFSSAAGLL